MNRFEPTREKWLGWEQVDPDEYQPLFDGEILLRRGPWNVNFYDGYLCIWNDGDDPDELIYEGPEIDHDDVVRHLIDAGYRPRMKP